MSQARYGPRLIAKNLVVYILLSCRAPVSTVPRYDELLITPSRRPWLLQSKHSCLDWLLTWSALQRIISTTRAMYNSCEPCWLVFLTSHLLVSSNCQISNEFTLTYGKVVFSKNSSRLGLLNSNRLKHASNYVMTCNQAWTGIIPESESRKRSIRKTLVMKTCRRACILWSKVASVKKIDTTHAQLVLTTYQLRASEFCWLNLSSIASMP